jgi:hypothetical protein
LQRLQRRVAFERLLARLFAGDSPPWLLKGAYALELYLAGRARSTPDLDLSVPDPERLTPAEAETSYLDLAYERLGQAAERDLGDGLLFALQRPKSERTGAPGGGTRCSVKARVAGRIYARFYLDLGLGDPVLDPPDWVEGEPWLGFAGIPAARVALCPATQQSAEKVHAYTFPWQDRDNTRVKDLVDLVLLASSGSLEPERLKLALEATFAARDTHPLLEQLPEPP